MESLQIARHSRSAELPEHARRGKASRRTIDSGKNLGDREVGLASGEHPASGSSLAIALGGDAHDRRGNSGTPVLEGRVGLLDVDIRERSDANNVGEAGAVRAAEGEGVRAGGVGLGCERAESQSVC